MKTTISQDTYNEVSRLVECVLSAYTKKQAEPYIKRLEFLHRSGGYGGYVNIVFADLIASTKRASGKVADKEKLCGFTRTDLYKLEYQISNDSNGGSDNE